MLARSISHALLFLSTALCTAAPAFAALDRWEPVGPEGGSIVSLVLDPSDSRVLYAGTAAGGVFKSTDGAGSWRLASDGLAPRRVWNLAIDPQSPQTLYAAVWDGGVIKSTDGARTWQAAGAGLSEEGVGERRVVAVDPGAPSTLYAAVGRRLFKSTDAAATWSRLGLESEQEVTALAVDPVHRAVLAGNRVGEIFRSTDGGATWTLARARQDLYPAQGFAFHPQGLAAYAATGNGLLRSADGGVTWQPAGQSGLLSRNVAAVAVHPATPRILYLGALGYLGPNGFVSGGVFRSGDQGRTWSRVSGELETDSAAALAIDPARPSTLYAGDTGKGVFKSTDAAGGWSAANRGLRAVDLTGVEIDPKRPGTIFAGSGSGLFKTADGGTTWRKVLDQRVFLGGLALDLLRPLTLYVLGDGFFKSTDGGATFLPLSAPGFLIAIAVDPRSHTLYLGSNRTVLRSADGGRSWSTPTDPSGLSCTSVSTFHFLPGASSAILAAGFPACIANQGGGLSKSTDGGRTWASVGQGTDRPHSVFALTADPADPRTLYAGGEGVLPAWRGAFKSTDGGINWMHLPDFGDGRNVAQAFAFLREPEALYAGTDDFGFGERGVFETRNGGLTWDPVNEGLTSLSIRELAAAPGSGSTLYAATGGGLFRRTRAE